MTEKDLDRFMKFVSVSSEKEGCWEWIGGRTGRGYGGFWIDGRTIQAHRVSYEHFVGPISEGLQLDHLCRNRGCVNPKHVEAVTCQENLVRGISHNGSKTHCMQGHEYTPENVLTVRGRHRRICRECNRISCAERHRRRKVHQSSPMTSEA
jgi:hypothetical protein